MILIIAVGKILTILAIYGGLVLALERRSTSRLSPVDGSRHAETTAKARVRRSGRVA